MTLWQYTYLCINIVCTYVYISNNNSTKQSGHSFQEPVDEEKHKRKPSIGHYVDVVVSVVAVVTVS